VTSCTDDGDDTMSQHNVLRESLGVPKPISLTKVTLRH
jgi:hypothetical protein